MYSIIIFGLFKMLVYVHWFLKLQQMTCLYHEQLYDAVSCYIYMYSCQQEQYPWKALCIHWLVYQTAHTSSNEFKEVPENGGCLDPKTSEHRHATQRMKKQSDVSRCIPWYVLQRVWSLADVGIHIFAAVATVSRSLPANETKKNTAVSGTSMGKISSHSSDSSIISTARINLSLL